jgi:hypothetical protein
VQSKVEQEAILTRHNIKTEESKQNVLFSDEQIVEFQTEQDGVGCPANLQAAGRLMQEVVSNQPGITFKKLAPLIMEQVAVRETNLKTIANDQRKLGYLHFELEVGKRTPSGETRFFIRG